MILYSKNDLKFGKMPWTTQMAFLFLYVRGKTNTDDVRPTAQGGGVCTKGSSSKTALSIFYVLLIYQ